MITIGITYSESRFDYYPNWIKGQDANIETITLHPYNFKDLRKCDAVIISGGVDTHPKFYKNDRLDYPFAPKEFNKKRDEFEFKVFEYTQKHQLPLLAICRGMQLVNIALGGDLIQDLEEHNKANHKRTETADGIHEVKTIPGTFLESCVGVPSGQINSAHHQGFGRVADDLMVSALSPDGVAEAAEWKDKNNKPFLVCVQWHPERLAELQPNNPFTKNIRNTFIASIKSRTA